MATRSEGRLGEMKWLILALVLLVGCSSVSPVACYEDNCFTLEIADDSASRATGLMHRTHLDVDKGMLFVYPEEGVYKFWMKNTLIPLDMIWLDSDGSVVFVYEDAQPCGEAECIPIDPGVEARYVLEVNSGIVGSLGIGVGDLIRLSLISSYIQ